MNKMYNPQNLTIAALLFVLSSLLCLTTNAAPTQNASNSYVDATVKNYLLLPMVVSRAFG